MNKPENVTIRRMSSEDLTAILEIENDSHAMAWPWEGFLGEMRNPYSLSFVAHDDFRILAYLVFWMLCDEVHLLNLTVHRDFRGRGLGKMLMKFLINFSLQNGAKWISLEVRSSNSAALAIYHAFGFQEKRIRKNYYQSNQEDGIIMELELGSGTTVFNQPGIAI